MTETEAYEEVKKIWGESGFVRTITKPDGTIHYEIGQELDLFGTSFKIAYGVGYSWEEALIDFFKFYKPPDVTR